MSLVSCQLAPAARCSPGLLLELGRHYPQLEELELEGLTLSEATRAAAELGRLTRLVGRLRGLSAGQVGTSRLVLFSGHFLPNPIRCNPKYKPQLRLACTPSR